eukprot:6083426-Prymnesium_polylepis.1
MFVAYDKHPAHGTRIVSTQRLAPLAFLSAQSEHTRSRPFAVGVSPVEAAVIICYHTRRYVIIHHYFVTLSAIIPRCVSTVFCLWVGTSPPALRALRADTPRPA